MCFSLRAHEGAWVVHGCWAGSSDALAAGSGVGEAEQDLGYLGLRSSAQKSTSSQGCIGFSFMAI